MWKQPHKTLTVVLGLLGCGAPSSYPMVVGTYVATRAESIVFHPDKKVQHIQRVEGREQRETLGYVRPVSGAMNQWEVFAPDSSPFIGTRFESESTFTQITVHWQNLRSNREIRQSQFQRAGNR